MTAMSKFPISALPVAGPSRLLIHHLTPDTHTPSPTVFRTNVITNNPSLQRRARLLSPPCHFSHVTPFPVAFPYDIEPQISSDPAKEDKGAFIERWLAAREAVHPYPAPSAHPNAILRKYYPKNRDQPLELIGLSETGIRDCVPHLDIGDSLTIIGAPSLSNEFEDEGAGQPSEIQGVVESRKDLVDILSGHATLMSAPEVTEGGFAPWSLRYSGHQFGSWAGQLGDGRAVSILVTPHPSDPDLTYELQLKGSGRTPFSRSADGLAVLRSSIREYLCSEAMQALGIPTTRALSLVSLPALPVARERMETGCVLTRIAPSFIRIGNFEALNGPTNMFFFGGGQQKPDLDALRILGEWVVKNVLKLPVEEGKAWGKELVFEVARRNAKMVAGWQAYGFMHGVINTDNVSILGLTIDYGPYAFMDVFDPFHICNHTDESGRYSYKYQPNMIVYALRALLQSLAPLIGAESEILSGGAVTAGWSDNISQAKLDDWTKKGFEVKDKLERVIQQTTAVEYGRLMRNRLGLRRQDPTDESRLFKPLLDIMETHKLDFHSTFRTLCLFSPCLLDELEANDKTPSSDLQAFITRLLSVTSEPEKLDYGAATEQCLAWLETYAERIRNEQKSAVELGWSEDPTIVDKEREAAMRAVNPRFVLRQWLLEEVIKKVERDSDSGKRVLAKVMHMACNPFEPWGEEGDEHLREEATKEVMEERRYCGLGEKTMLGFQCSCSS